MTRMRYFALLDPVRFRPDLDAELLQHRELTATRELLRAILLDGVAPVLSDVQAFDNRMLLDLIAAEDRDAAAFLRLVREGHVRTRIFSERSMPGRPLTLLSAFRFCVEKETFTFSAWPELVDADTREAVLRALDGHEMLTGDLGQRVQAVQLLDAQLQVSADDELATPVSGPGLAGLVDADLDGPGQSTVVAKFWTLVRQHRRDSGDKYALGERSRWYELLDDVAALNGWAQDHGAVRAVRNAVDLHYNRILVRSLGASGFTDEKDQSSGRPFELVRVSRPPSVAVQSSGVLQELDGQVALSWRDAIGLLDDLTVLSQRGRTAWLREEGFIDTPAPDRVTWRVRLGEGRLRTITVDGGATMTSALVGAGIGGFRGAVIGAVTEIGVRQFFGGTGVVGDEIQPGARHSYVLREG